jgi:hypothetical protein
VVLALSGNTSVGPLEKNFLHQSGLVREHSCFSRNSVDIWRFKRHLKRSYAAHAALPPHMQKLFFVAFLSVLVFSLGCGAGPGIHGIGGGGGGTTGSYSNASLKGSYVYHLSGTDVSTGTSAVPYEEAGVFTADGNGHITGGVDDFTEGNIAGLGSTISGTYAIASDGTGSVVLSGTGFTINLVVTLVSSSKAYLVEADALNASGVAEIQSSSAIAASPTGTFVFRIHTTSEQGSAAAVGQFTVATGILQSGSVDVNRSGTLTSPALTNFTFNSPLSNGRGTGNFTQSTGVTSAFNYYIIDSNTIELLSTDTSSSIGGHGRAELQTGGPFSVSSFSGSYVYGSQGDDNSGIDSVNTVGEFKASSGTFTSGSYDSVHDGTPLNNVAVTGGTYQVASNGRVAATLTSSSSTVNKVLWMVNPSRAFFVTASDTSDSFLTEDGIADLQSASTFSNASINGQFAFMMHGFNPNFFIDRVGTLQWDGSGNLKLNEFVNDTGSTNSPGLLTGTYSVAANGRATGNINTLSVNSNDLIFYMISNTDGYVLQEDPGTELIGRISQQR